MPFQKMSLPQQPRNTFGIVIINLAGEKLIIVFSLISDIIISEQRVYKVAQMFIPLLIFHVVLFFVAQLVGKLIKFAKKNTVALSMITLARNSPLSPAIAVVTPLVSPALVISVEMNANGICRCAFGPNGYDRETFEEMDLPQLEVEITHPTRDGGRCWMAQTLIPAQTIQTIYNLSSQLQVGHQMEANFHTACESTHAPYWGSWTPISTPNFHFHEYFGLLEIA